MTVFIFFIILQIADGFFTLHGVNAVGIDGYESNTLIAYTMYKFGIGNSLLVFKVTGILLGYALYKLKRFSALWFVSGVYFLNFLEQIVFFIEYRG